VAATVRSLMAHSRPEQIQRIVLLADCMSSVPDLEDAGRQFLIEWRARW
jgi:hypothetical protein